MAQMSSGQEFDLRLARECAGAFSVATGLGCVVSDVRGAVLHETGFGCASCGLCAAVGQRAETCARSQAYGMSEAERFGGKYIYFCPLGLTCFVSPIVGESGGTAKITAGPFLMVDRQDYIACDLADGLSLPAETLARAQREVERMPVVAPERVEPMATLLFMAVGFMNNVSAANRMLETQGSDALQGQITSYIMQLKQEGGAPPYPFETEHALLHAIARGDKPEAQRLLNELFGHIFFSAGGDFAQAKTRVYELLVLISRSAVDAGADPENALRLSHQYLQAMGRMTNVDELCFWLTGVMNSFVDSVFNYVDAKHASVIHKSVQYLRTHYAEKITLDAMAGMVYLSPAYFSRVFKQETGQTFNVYLNTLRIEKSKEMLLHEGLRLTDIALMVGFEDQSYFTKVFKRVTGMAPLRYRETKGKARRG